MDLTSFFITIAPPLVLFASILVVFLWATYAKAPAFAIEDENHKGKKDVVKNKF